MSTIFDTWNPRHYQIQRPYVPGRLHYSHPDPARYMLIGHSKNWPAHVERDRYHNADHDRIRSWKGCDLFNEIVKRLTGTGDLGLNDFVARAKDRDVAGLIFELMDCEVEAWRVLGTVNRSNGYPVFSLEWITPAAQPPAGDT